jgi:hypothetical protein
VFRYGDLGQHSPLIYWRDSSVEEGAWLWQAVCHLGGISSHQNPLMSVA